jgi:hypothetical protein
MMHIQWKRVGDGDKRLVRSIFLLVGSEPKFLEFLFDPKEPRIRRRAGILRDEARVFSEAEQLVVRAALDLWCGSGHVQLWELIEAWDAEQWARFIRAIGELKNLPSGTII